MASRLAPRTVHRKKPGTGIFSKRVFTGVRAVMPNEPWTRRSGSLNRQKSTKTTTGALLEAGAACAAPFASDVK
jgi:hypothetical protein